MIERDTEECRRCHGTGRVTTKGVDFAVLCSCPAGRSIAAPPIRVVIIRHLVPAFGSVVVGG